MLAAAALAGCSGHADTGSSAGVVVPGRPSDAPTAGTFFDQPVPAAVADLPLVDQDGHRFTLASLHGKTVVLTDFLTLCQEICPLTTVNLRQVDQAVAASGNTGQVVIVEVTVDPARDTPARLAAYQKMVGAPGNWRFATGSPSDLAQLWKTLGVHYAKAKGDAGARDWWTGKPLTYDVEHQDLVFVLGPDGHERWVEDGTPNTGGQAPSGKLGTFLSAQGRQNVTAPADPSWTAGDVEAALAYVTAHPTG